MIKTTIRSCCSESMTGFRYSRLSFCYSGFSYLFNIFFNFLNYKFWTYFLCINKLVAVISFGGYWWSRHNSSRNRCYVCWYNWWCLHFMFGLRSGLWHRQNTSPQEADKSNIKQKDYIFALIFYSNKLISITWNIIF